MPELLQLRGEGAVLSLLVRGYENDAAVTSSDANWLVCDLAVEMPAFEARLSAAITTHDLECFAAELREALQSMVGRASLTTDEQQVSARIELHRTGRAKVDGELRTIGRPSGTLAFGFDSDQTYLQQSLRDVDRVLAAYPIRGEVSGSTETT